MSAQLDPDWLRQRIANLTAAMQHVPPDERQPFEDTVAALRRALVRVAMERDNASWE